MKTIQLYGQLADEYGHEPIKLEVPNITMAVRALFVRFGEEFEKKFKATNFNVFVGKLRKRKNHSKKYGYFHKNSKNVSEQELKFNRKENEIHFVPAVEGSGNVWRIIAGVVLVVVGIIGNNYGGWGTPFIQAGIGLIVGGVVGLLTPMPKTGGYTDGQDKSKASFIFNGAFNVTVQGGPVPLVYGRIRAGSTVISAGVDVEQIGSTTLVNYDDSNGYEGYDYF
jgi:predicted phage tail protein